MSKPKVLMTNPTVPKVAVEILREKCEVIECENQDRDEILSKIRGVDAVFWSTKIPLDKEVLDAAGPKLRVIGTKSAGYNHIDVEELRKRGIKLGNASGTGHAVADMAVLLALAASRRMHEARLRIETNTWEQGEQWLMGQDIFQSTVGIIGLGSIGKAICQRLKPFGVKEFLYTGPREKPEGLTLGAKFVNLDNLAKKSDFIIICCPLNDKTKFMINDNFFEKTKNTAVLVNIGRGEIVDQEALIRALKFGKIFAAGLDVMSPEPLPNDHELLGLPNVVLMPHLGAATRSTKEAMSVLTAENIIKGLSGEEMHTPVC